MQAAEFTNEWTTGLAILGGIHDRARKDGVPVQVTVQGRLVQRAAEKALEAGLLDKAGLGKDLLEQYAKEQGIAKEFDETVLLASGAARGRRDAGGADVVRCDRRRREPDPGLGRSGARRKVGCRRSERGSWESQWARDESVRAREGSHACSHSGQGHPRRGVVQKRLQASEVRIQARKCAHLRG